VDGREIEDRFANSAVLGFRGGGPSVLDSGDGVIISELSLGVPGLAMVCRIVRCGADPLTIFPGGRSIPTAVTLGTLCHGDGLELGLNKDGVGGEVGFRLACCWCCCFFLSFCDIFIEDEDSDGTGAISGLTARPRDRLEVRDCDACSIIVFMSSLTDGRSVACQGRPALPRVVNGSGMTNAGDGLASKPCSLTEYWRP
jgi:hypothetical protein